MWQRFTERARKAVFEAQKEAVERNSDLVGPEHLLLGMLRETNTVAIKMLIQMGVEPLQLRETLAAQTVQGEGRKSNDMQLDLYCQQVVHHSYKEARALNKSYIGTEHLLLGLLRESEGRPGGPAGRLLYERGVDLVRARAVLQEIEGGEGSGANRPQFKAPDVSEETEINFPGMGKVRPLRATAQPEETPAVPQTLRGQIGVLRDGERSRVELTPIREDVPAFLDMMMLKDEFAYQEMAQAAKFLHIAAGTAIKVLAAGPEQVQAPMVQVRILQGEFAGRTGYVTQTLLHDLHPDDRPFPPAEFPDTRGEERAGSD